MSGSVVDAETWLRRRGLPQVLPASARVRRLVRRCAPLLSAIAVLDVCWRIVTIIDGHWVGAEAAEGPDDLPGVDAAFAVMVLLLLVSPFLAALVSWIVSRLTRGSGVGPKIVGGLVCVLMVTGAPVVGSAYGEYAFGPAVVGRCAVALLLLWVAFLGAGTLVKWAVRRTLTELASVGPMVLRVLPVLMLAVLFLFFNAEIWQVAFGVSTARAVAVGLVLGILAVLVVVVTALDEIRPVLDRDEDTHEPAWLDGTPFAGAGFAHQAERFSVGERINFLLIPIAAQSIQVMIFGVLMLAFFLLFGSLSITDAVAKTWIGQSPPRMEILGVALPVSVPLARVSFILSNFCALSFAASASSDSAYRAAFLEPILHETRVNLAARHAYQHLPPAGGEHSSEALDPEAPQTHEPEPPGADSPRSGHGGGLAGDVG